MADLLPTAYRGSLAATAEAALKGLGSDLSHGTRNLEGMRDGRLIHRCVDIKSGRWVEVTPGVGYRAHEKVADGHLPAPYPFCRTPAECAGKGYCPKEIACND